MLCGNMRQIRWFFVLRENHFLHKNKAVFLHKTVEISQEILYYMMKGSVTLKC